MSLYYQLSHINIRYTFQSLHYEVFILFYVCNFRPFQWAHGLEKYVEKREGLEMYKECVKKQHKTKYYVTRNKLK